MADVVVTAAAPEPRGNPNYIRGATFERAVMADLAGDGYRVLRAAGSHGKADVIALKPGQVLLVQCKLSGPGRVPPAEWNALWGLAREVGAVPLVAHKPARGRIEYLRLTGPKHRPARRPPAVVWTADDLAERETIDVDT